MTLFNTAKNFLSNFVHSDWWLEVTTTEPHCIYYFGPFDHANEAEEARAGYIQDLESEGAKGISTLVKRCNPKAMTIEGSRE